MSELENTLQQKILVLDGAMGTMIQGYKLNEADFRNLHPSISTNLQNIIEKIDSPLKGNNDLLSLTQPEIISTIHEQYLAAGADIIETNTFNATSISQSDYNAEALVFEINLRSAQIAKEAAVKYTKQNPLKPRFVAGAIGPTNQTASMSPDVNDPGYRATSFNDLRFAYEEQCDALIQGGVDALLIETIFDTLNAKAAIFAARNSIDKSGSGIPIMISGTITDKSGRTLSGQTLEAFMISIDHSNMLSVGLNCAFGADQLLDYIKVLAQKANCYISAYPNAGLPNEFGEYDETAEIMKEKIRPYLELGLVNIIGGCCGTSPDHISAIASIAKDYSPRKLKTSLV